MKLYRGNGEQIEIDNNNKYKHSVVKTMVVVGGDEKVKTVNLDENYIEGTLMIRGGGSYMPYKVYDANNKVLTNGISWGNSTTKVDAVGGVKIELNPTTNATIIWKVEEESEYELPNDYRAGRVLIWNDEFNERKLDLNKWYEEKSYKRRGSERGDGTNTFVQNNELHLRIMREKQYLENHTDREWSGTVLHSHFYYKYGLAEARIKFADCGAWMSFWTVGANMDEYPEENYNNGIPWTKCGEMDFVECNGGLGISGNIHYDANKGNDDDKIEVYNDSSFNGMDDYHVYSCEWTEDNITMYVDYHKVGEVNVEDLKTTDEYNAFKLAHRILFSCQPVLPGNYNTRVPADNCNKLEGVVDWVRVYAPIGWDNIEPTKLLIDDNDGSQIIELKVGDIHDCNITIEPNQVVNQSTIWTSSIPSVATIGRTAGHIEAISQGYTTITAKMWNGVQTSIVVHVTAVE